MTTVFLVFGYGVPKTILKDENYNFYLKTAFNKIYSSVVKNKITKPIIIFCGGNTDCCKPYKRNEADEMMTLFTTIMKQRPFLKSLTRQWLFISEKKSLSTLENLINSKKIMARRKIKPATWFICCEQTRERRIKILAKKILHNTVQVMPIDFDTSANRYLPPEYLDKKEKLELKQALWALRRPANLKKHHTVFKEKFEYLRNVEQHTHSQVVKAWWDQKLEKSKNEHNSA